MKKLKGPPDPIMIAKFVLAWNLTNQYGNPGGPDAADAAGHRFLARIGRTSIPETHQFWTAVSRYPPG